jgi:biotin synthase-like enzyme
MTIQERIAQNNATHIVHQQELLTLIKKANTVYNENFDDTVWFERSIFTNWTCAIADCSYCYLSTKPKHTPGSTPTAIRSKESIVAEAIICKHMGWRVGYITGGLRVESVNQLIELTTLLKKVTGKKVMMNYGPFALSEIKKLQISVSGMGCAIESFDEELHSFICPSKPLRTLLLFLQHLQNENMEKLITIILGLGERKDDVFRVIKNIKQYKITTIQLCFLKPQENTPFATVPPPNMKYMAWWIAQIRVECPTIKIKVALVHERIDDFSLLLEAGANCFSRFMVFKDFASDFAKTLETECLKANRTLQGNFLQLPKIDIATDITTYAFEKDFERKVEKKIEEYYQRLTKCLV